MAHILELIFLGHELNVVGKEFVFVAQVDCCDTEKIHTGIISCEQKLFLLALEIFLRAPEIILMAQEQIVLAHEINDYSLRCRE